MKNVRRKTSWLFGLILATALLLLATIFSRASAYFTSTTKKSGDVVFAEISLVIDSTNDGDALFSKELSNVLPGDTITFNNISVKNEGEADVYTIINLSIIISKTDGNDYVINNCYNLQGQGIAISNMSSNTTGATLIEKGKSETLTLDYKLDGTTFNNDFKNAQISVVLNAVCIQAANLESMESISDDSLIAATLLVDKFFSIA